MCPSGRNLWTDIVEITFSRLGDVREENVTVDQHLKELKCSRQEIGSDFYQTVTGAMSCQKDTALVENILRIEGSQTMRPVQLELTNFGPYRKEVINFTQFDHAPSF